MQSSNAQLLPQPSCPKPKRHNAKLCPFAIRQRIINALANGDSIRAIARALHVSNNTVAAIREQEWQQVATRKERIAAQCELNATLAAERMTNKLQGTDDIPLNTLVPAFGVSVDKLALLRGHAPSVNIANIVLPTEEERAERRASSRRAGRHRTKTCRESRESSTLDIANTRHQFSEAAVLFL